jgi:chromosome segregation ATPase
MARRPSAPPDLVERLRPLFAAELQRLQQGEAAGQRGHRTTRARLACDLIARAEGLQPTTPLVRALIQAGSPNDIGEDIRRWTRDAAQRLARIDMPAGFEHLAQQVQDLARDIALGAQQRAEEALQPERDDLARQRAALDEERSASTALLIDARHKAESLQERVTTLEAQLSVEHSKRAGAEQLIDRLEREAAHLSAQRDAEAEAARKAKSLEQAAQAAAASLEEQLLKADARTVERAEVAAAAVVRAEQSQRDLDATRERLLETARALSQRDTEAQLTRARIDELTALLAATASERDELREISMRARAERAVAAAERAELVRLRKAIARTPQAKRGLPARRLTRTYMED